MEITNFTNRVSNNSFNPFPRLIAQRIKSMMKDNCGTKEIEVPNDDFDDIIRATGITPTIGHVYKFIRIADNNGNAVDIQTTKNKGQ